MSFRIETLCSDSLDIWLLWMVVDWPFIDLTYYSASSLFAISRRHLQMVLVFRSTELAQHVLSWRKPSAYQRRSLLLILYLLNPHQIWVTVIAFCHCLVPVHLLNLLISWKLLWNLFNHRLESHLLFIIRVLKWGKLFHQWVFLMSPFNDIESVGPEESVDF